MIMKKPKNYSLVKLKLLKGGGIDITFREKSIVNGITDTKDWNLKNSENPHPDLVELVEALKVYLAKCYNLDAFVTLANSKGVGAKKEQSFEAVKELIDKTYLTILSKIDVTGITITGEIENDKDKRSVVITGTQLQENKSKTPLNSPKIKLINDTFKFEADVQELVNKIEDEAAEYLFNNKKAQLSMFDETSNVEEKEAA